MAKYMDLLRQHQNKTAKPSVPATAASEAPEADLNEGHAELETMLADESENHKVSSVLDDDFSNSSLMTDEEDQTDDQFHGQSSPLLTTPITEPGQSPNNREMSAWLTVCIQQAAKLFQSASANEVTDLHPLIHQLNTLLEHLNHDEKLINVLELEISTRQKQVSNLDADLGPLIQKSIMMMLYAIKVGQRLKFNRDELRSHILAAMVHHIGMAQIPGSIRNKKEQLTKDELYEIRTAPKKSHDYLSSCGVTDAAILLAASQAPERFDGSGPQGLNGSDIAYSARMVGLISMFEALIHYRPYRNRLLPRDAIRELVNHHKQAFDPRLLKALIESISLYPVGTYVQLNSGDIGRVIQVNPRLPLRPLVRMILDSHGDAINPRDIDLHKQPNLMVQRCMYEEGLQELKDSAEQGNR